MQRPKDACVSATTGAGLDGWYDWLNLKRDGRTEPVGRSTSTASVDEAGTPDEDAPLPPKAKWTDPFE